MCSILFPSQSPDIGDPGGVTHIIHMGFDLRKVSGSMSLSRIMVHSDHDQPIQNPDKCVKAKIMFDILEKSLYNNRLDVFFHTSDIGGKSAGYNTGILERKSSA
jgi:hypothetical protein